MEDYKFDRLNPIEREACYRRKLAPPPVAAAVVPPSNSAAALPANRRTRSICGAPPAQGRMPQNDVRFQEQMERYLHPGSR